MTHEDLDISSIRFLTVSNFLLALQFLNLIGTLKGIKYCSMFLIYLYSDLQNALL